jgi:Acyl-coenzyme A:6-aminopenicillanic acid acyl-transferase
VGVRVDEELLTGIDAAVVVRHLRIRGSHAAIGRALAALAIERSGLRPEDLLADARFVRARRANFRRDYPIHARRMEGVAGALGLRADDDRFDCSTLRTPSVGSGAGALLGRASYAPPWTARDGHGRLVRSASGEAAAPIELYVMEWHPSGPVGPSLAVHAFDLLAGTLTGINAAGLTVAGVATDASESVGDHPADRIGLHELALLRLVLDTSDTVEQAEAVLLGARHIPLMATLRYLVADRTGASFAYEPSPSGPARIVDATGAPQEVASPAGRSEARAGGPGTVERRRPGTGWSCSIDQKGRRLALRLPGPQQDGGSRAKERRAPDPEHGQSEPAAEIVVAI